MFLRATMGLNATGDEYCRWGDEALGDLHNKVKVVNYVLRSDEEFEKHVKVVRELLESCRRHHITLNTEKFNFARE